MSTSPTARDLGLLIARLGASMVFIYHGSQKLFGAFGGPGMEGFTGFIKSLNVPMPEVGAWLAAITEFGGGIALAIGLLTRIVGVPMAFNMVVAFATAHHWSLSNNGDFAALLGLVTLSFIFTGAGQLSLDAVIKTKLSKP